MAPLDVGDLDVTEQPCEALGRVADDLVGWRLVGGEREDADEQLQPDAVLPASRDVLHVALGGSRAAVRVGDDDLVVADPDDAAVSCDQAVVEVHRRRPGRVAVGDVRHHPLAVVGMKGGTEEIRVCEPLLLGVAHQVGDLRADVEGSALVVELVDVDDERQPLNELLEVETCHPYGDRSEWRGNEGSDASRLAGSLNFAPRRPTTWT